VDNGIMAIVVLAIVVWEFIQRATPENPPRKGVSQRDAAMREAPSARRGDVAGAKILEDCVAKKIPGC
jgi:hypothetical protein